MFSIVVIIDGGVKDIEEVLGVVDVWAIEKGLNTLLSGKL